MRLFYSLRILLSKQSLLTFIPSSEKTSRSKILGLFSSLRPIKTEINLIRIGDSNDGGYLVPDDLTGIQGLVSPGVGNTIRFDLEIAKDMPALLIDGTVSKPVNLPHNIDFLPLMLGSEVSLESLLDSFFPSARELILSMDIEGAEWQVLKNTNRLCLDSFRIIVIELHNLHTLLNFKDYTSKKEIIDKILANFSVLHLHCNNGGGHFYFQGTKLPRVIELTLLRNDRFTKNYGFAKIPNRLDSKNLPDKPEIKLSNIFSFMR